MIARNLTFEYSQNQQPLSELGDRIATDGEGVVDALQVEYGVAAGDVVGAVVGGNRFSGGGTNSLFALHRSRMDEERWGNRVRAFMCADVNSARSHACAQGFERGNWATYQVEPEL